MASLTQSINKQVELRQELANTLSKNNISSQILEGASSVLVNVNGRGNVGVCVYGGYQVWGHGKECVRVMTVGEVVALFKMS